MLQKMFTAFIDDLNTKKEYNEDHFDEACVAVERNVQQALGPKGLEADVEIDPCYSDDYQKAFDMYITVWRTHDESDSTKLYKMQFCWDSEDGWTRRFG